MRRPGVEVPTDQGSGGVRWVVMGGEEVSREVWACPAQRARHRAAQKAG